MGMCRDAANQEIDIVKEMAESLGSQGLKIEDILEKAGQARIKAQQLIVEHYRRSRESDGNCVDVVNQSIQEYNSLVEKAEDARRWLLIQREACGFRTHRNVDQFYPIPPRIRLLDR